MDKWINYYSHKFATPLYYQRNYECDLLPQEKGETGWIATGKRIAGLTVPFLSLHKPVGLALSLSMGTTRCVTHFSSMIDACWKKKNCEAAQQMAQLALATMALAGSVFNFTFGLFLTTSHDCALNAYYALQNLAKGDYEKAAENLRQGLSSALYLAILCTGSLEITYVSLLIQAYFSFCEGGKEWMLGKYPEAAAKMLMGLIRGNQACNTYHIIARKNHLSAIYKQWEQFFEHVKNGRKVEHLLDNPLNDLQEKNLEKRVILTDADGKEYDFGSHFHGFGKEIVKGANLSFHTTLLNGKPVTELDFKINHVFRDRLSTLIQDLQALKRDDLQFLLTTSQSHASDIKIARVPFEISKTLKIGEAYKISFEGLGSVYVGESRYYPNLYDRIVVRMDEGKSLYELHEMLSFLKLDDALRVSTQDEIRRLKIGHLFRTFCPQEATPFERSPTFFDLPIQELEQEIVKKAPSMRDHFEKYLDKMEPHEILPGRIRYAITGLSDQAYALGARTLTAAVTGAYNDTELFHRIASMIKMGMVSSEMRYTNGIKASGLSPSYDFYTGGADSVFTQLLTEKNAKERMPYDRLNYHSKVRMMISVDAFETGTYQYPFDAYGARNKQIYLTRPGIQEFITDLNKYMDPGHEVMIKERIPPSLFQGLIVDTTTTRNSLLDYLRKCHIVQKENNIEKILGIDVDKFVRVGRYVEE